MAVHDGALDRRRLDHVLRHMGWAKIGTTRLGAEFGLYINTYNVVLVLAIGLDM